MRTMRLHTPQPITQSPLRLETVDVPEPRPQQIRIRVVVCGVCHTDLHTAEGDLELPRLPITPGHQVVGVVEQLGEGAGRFQVGDRVGVGWLNWTCGVCDFCRSGQENLCPQAKFTGLHADGGYATYTVVDERFAYPLPAVFSDTEAAPLLCAGIIGYRSLKLSGIRPGGRLGLYGFGASAHLANQVARHWDCEVYVFRTPAAGGGIRRGLDGWGKRTTAGCAGCRHHLCPGRFTYPPGSRSLAAGWHTGHQRRPPEPDPRITLRLTLRRTGATQCRQLHPAGRRRIFVVSGRNFHPHRGRVISPGRGQHRPATVEG
jgi:zinc-binding alcohol dehydrogenase family protein